jgi:hypothetical protein
MERNEIFTEAELLRMKAYEEKTGQRIRYTFAEKCEIYREADKERLIETARGIGNSLYNRISLDNLDCFDSPDETWKTKQLQENLQAILKVIAEKT